MKNYLLLFCAIALLASCSSPKYAYHFDHYDYNSGKKQKVTNSEVSKYQVEEVSFAIQDEELLASTTTETIYLAEVKEGTSIPNSLVKNSSTLTKGEKRELKKEAVKSIKSYVKAVKAGDHDKASEMAKAMDKDLKFAAIFGAVGIVAAIIGGDVFWVISAVAWIIAVIFFIKWLVRQ